MNLTKNKLKLHLQKFWHIYALGVIVLIAFFIRTYNFADWLYLKSDQARDLKKVQSVYDGGISKLPLLGPKASGSNLFLGPIFYYFQYASAVLFQSIEPHVLVFPDLIASLLTIPLLFYFLRQFFSKKVALLTVAVFASSYIFTQYSRFGWNPNSIPFWGLLAMLGVFKVGIEKNRKLAGKWLIVFAFAFGVVSQLHFIAFLGYPIVMLLFWFFYPPKKIQLKFWLTAIFLFLFLNLPLIANDTIGGGNNWEHFVYTLTHKGEPRGAVESAIRAVTYQGRFSMAFITSINNNEVEEVDLIGVIVIVLSVALGGFLWWKKKRVGWFGKISSKQRVFLLFLFFWLLGFMPLYWKLAYDLNNSRYWFVTFIIPFVSFAFCLQLFFQLGKEVGWKRFLRFIPYIATIFLIILNLTAVAKWYGSLAAQKEINFFERKWSSKTFKQKDLDVVWVQKEVSNYIVTEAKKNGKNICLKSPAVHASVYKFFIEYENKGDVIYGGDVERETFARLGTKCDFFLIDRTTKKNQLALEKIGKGLKLEDKHTVGAVAVWKIKLKETLVQEKNDVKEAEVKNKQQSSESKMELSEKDGSEKVAEEEKGIPERRGDKYWGDLWKK